MSEWELLSDEQLAVLTLESLMTARDEVTAAVVKIQGQLGNRGASIKEGYLESETRREEMRWRRQAKSALAHKLAFLQRVKRFIRERAAIEDVAKRIADCRAAGVTPTARRGIDILVDLVDALAGYDFSGDPRLMGLLEEGRSLATLRVREQATKDAA